jgi:hypothetical protein
MSSAPLFGCVGSEIRGDGGIAAPVVGVLVAPVSGGLGTGGVAGWGLTGAS